MLPPFKVDLVLPTVIMHAFWQAADWKRHKRACASEPATLDVVAPLTPPEFSGEQNMQTLPLNASMPPALDRVGGGAAGRAFSGVVRERSSSVLSERIAGTNGAGAQAVQLTTSPIPGPPLSRLTPAASSLSMLPAAEAAPPEPPPSTRGAPGRVTELSPVASSTAVNMLPAGGEASARRPPAGAAGGDGGGADDRSRPPAAGQLVVQRVSKFKAARQHWQPAEN